VKDHKSVNNGISSRFNCSQDSGEKGPSKKTNNPSKKPRDNPGMPRYGCQSSLRIRVVRRFSKIYIEVDISHHEKHPAYEDISMPAKAIAMVLQRLWTTPAIIATEVQRDFPEVKTSQIYYVWRNESERLWMRDKDPMKSAVTLLGEYPQEVEVFKIEPIEGVVALAWGLTSVARCLTDVVEVAMDATCKSITLHKMILH
jgi:hypothetical protein